eukprot:CAMPEP_0185031664 /NCGR_PEP_ID=MMETSP1103-20130426/19253_1 /TAXON_ID=36769 /ORGANISM="Paraphysomonas bandaiensis, Strain Caron Lab Isolate" /LENGTH=700 /DNA_ID=CAMNT_0027567257 /DNA_START=346 /DNA_END=2449 /DNA_ORIENTATION=-
MWEICLFDITVNSEGSSWKAYKVTDKLWVGGLTEGLVKDAQNLAIDFLFGCQTSETGLFRSQLADGIMGMSRSASTLVPQLYEHKVVDSKIFGLCFRIGGGIMTLGGIDQRIHSSDILYAKIYPSSSNWFTVRLLELALVENTVKKEVHIVSSSASILNSGSGVIIDSGTTDTYLPSRLSADFVRAFELATGIKYSNKPMTLTAKQIEKLPNIRIKLQGVSGHDDDVVELIMPLSSYADTDGKGKYTFRVYLTESSGGVLGANFMRGMNIIFDDYHQKVGFASSSCRYEDYEDIEVTPPASVFTMPPIPAPVPLPVDSNNCTLSPTGYCTATCRRNVGTKPKPYVMLGNQSFFDDCTFKEIQKPCREFCRSDNTIARGPSLKCLNTVWSECDHHCKQTRMVATGNEKKCKMKKEVRSCTTDNCPKNLEDFFVLADLKFWFPPVVPPGKWDKIYEEDLFTALSKILEVPVGNMDLLVDMEADSSDSSFRRLSYKRFVKLQLQVFISRAAYPRVEYFNNQVQYVLDILNLPSLKFGELVMPILNEICAERDGGRVIRYAALFPEDIVVQRAVALPMSNQRDPFNIPNAVPSATTTSDSAGGLSMNEYFLIGIALGAVVIMIVVLVMYYRLKLEHAALAKDKSISGGTSMVQMWNRLKAADSRRTTRANPQMFPSADAGSSRGLMAAANDDSDDENDSEFGLK